MNADMSTLLFWQGKGGRGAANNAANGGQNSNGVSGQVNGLHRNWIHAPDALLKGHVAYLVKFLGSTTVDQPKGIEVVKDAIRRLQFTQQLKKSETGAKTKKVEITISVDGVAIQEPRTNNILHQFPLHRISYCADDKGAKKFFSFIAKGVPPNTQNGLDSKSEKIITNGNAKEEHECFVFISNKLAAEITLTIGQAFDLAYRRFLTDNGKYIEMQKMNLQMKKLESQVSAYKSRLDEVTSMLSKSDLRTLLSKHSIQDLSEFKCPQDIENSLMALMNGDAKQANGSKTPELGIDLSSTMSADSSFNSTVNNLLLDTSHNEKPYTNGNSKFNNSHHVDLITDFSSQSKNPSVGTKLEGLLLNSDSDSDFDPRACESDPPAAAMLFPPAAFPAAAPEQALLGNSPSPSKTLGQQLFSSSHNGTAPLLAPPPKATSKRQTAPQQVNMSPNAKIADDLFGSEPFAVRPQAAAPPPSSAAINIVHSNHNNGQQLNGSGLSTTPNYNITDLSINNSVFSPPPTSNGTNGNTMVGFDPFDMGKFNGNIFGSPIGFNGFGPNGIFGNEKQANAVTLDSNFSGFLDKRISEMKDGFSRGLAFGNVDFAIEGIKH